MAPARVSPEQCAEREEIAESIRSVIGEILSLHTAAVDANGDLNKMERIDQELQNAQARESSLLEKFQAHLKSHGCQRQKALR
jgi:hypothetical protein